MLTAKTLENLKPREKQYREPDKDGLSVLVRPSGAKLFQYRYRFAGKEKIFSYGQFPGVSLIEARQAHEAVRRIIRQGLDPMTEKRVKKAAALADSANDFKSVAKDWHAAQARKWIPSHAAKVWRNVEDNLLCDIGGLPVSQITTPILLGVIKKIEKRGAVDVASRSQQRATSILAYAVQHGLLEHNVGLNLRGVVVARPQVHQVAVGVDEVGELVNRIGNYSEEFGRGRLTQLALQLTLHTFLRSTEIRGAFWSEFDFEKREWVVPGIRDAAKGNGGMKMKVPHIIPLSDQVVSVLEEIKGLGLSDELVFPVRRGSKTIMSENTMNKALNLMGYKGRQTVHGLRTVASTILNRGSKKQKWNKDAIERQLAHSPASSDSVRDAYNRYEFLDERVEMMKWYSNELERLAKGARVPELKRA